MKVYIASKIKYAEHFRRLRTKWQEKGIHLHARWFDQAKLEEDSNSEDFHIFWLVDEYDVKDSCAVIIYGEIEDELRGALVEAGIAIGAGILTIIVGDSPSFGTWQHHPKVVRASSLEHAKNMIIRLYT